MSRQITLVILVALALFASTGGADPRAFHVAPRGSWVADVQDETPGADSTRDATGGLHYELLDFQSNLAAQPPEFFTHVRLRVLNEDGLEEAAQISIDLDPSYERLTIHDVRILRGTRGIPALDPAKVRVLQRETGLEYRVFSGSRTVVITLEDVRVGDLVEFAYTLAGANPALLSHAGATVGLASPRAAGRFEHRLLWPGERDARIGYHRTQLAPRIGRSGGHVEYVWSLRDVRAREFVPWVPQGIDPLPFVELSSFRDWGEVARWGAALYAAPASVPAAVRAVADTIARRTGDPEQRALAALQFVQENVRYLADMLGEGAFRPRPSGEVMRRRFGDCKDKVALLLDLLRALAIEAAPALMSTTRGRELNEAIPGVGPFDHVIVRIPLDGREHWVDPTRRGQRGVRLDQRSAADDTWALVLTPDTDRLVRMARPKEARPRTHIERRILATDYRQPAHLTVTTVFGGSAAEGARLRLRGKSLETSSESYRKYYEAIYPEVRKRSDLSVTDEEDSNRVTVVESYEIPQFWIADSTTGRYMANVGAQEMADYLPPRVHDERDVPLALTGPGITSCDTWVETPEKEWSIKPSRRTAGGAYVQCRSREETSGNTLRLHHEIETFDWLVPASSARAFSEEIDGAVDMFEFVIQSPLGRAGRATLGGMNWPVVVLLLVGLVSGARLVVWGCRMPAPPDWWIRRTAPWAVPPPAPAPASDVASATAPDSASSSASDDSPLTASDAAPAVETSIEPRRIGGWLVVLGLGMIVGMVRRVMETMRLLAILDRAAWAATLDLAGADRGLMEFLLVFELLANVLFIALQTVAIVTFFTRRQSFPFLLVLMMLGITTFSIMDIGLALQLEPGTVSTGPREVSALAGSVVGLALWSTYIVRSRRARQTFVR